MEPEIQKAIQLFRYHQKASRFLAGEIRKFSKSSVKSDDKKPVVSIEIFLFTIKLSFVDSFWMIKPFKILTYFLKLSNVYVWCSYKRWEITKKNHFMFNFDINNKNIKNDFFSFMYT